MGRNRKTTFLGVPMSQEWADFEIWETFFESFPIKSFLELGTGAGGMSMFFALHCAQKGISFHTIDHERWLDFSLRVPTLLGMEQNYLHLDLFANDGLITKGLIETLPRPLTIFFDDGNKPREWAMFGPLTQPGDFCIVHDWETEFFPKDLGNLPVERILEELSDARPDGWKSMWFRRI